MGSVVIDIDNDNTFEKREEEEMVWRWPKTPKQTGFGLVNRNGFMKSSFLVSPIMTTKYYGRMSMNKMSALS